MHDVHTWYIFSVMLLITDGACVLEYIIHAAPSPHQKTTLISTEDNETEIHKNRCDLWKCGGQKYTCNLFRLQQDFAGALEVDDDLWPAGGGELPGFML